MRVARTSVLIGVILLTTGWLVARATNVGAQNQQHEVSQRLLSDDSGERAAALDDAQGMRPEDLGQELLAALIESLDREARVHVERDRVARRGDALTDLEDPEFVARAVRVVAALQDPRGIPALTRALGGGFVAIRALTAFGDAAAPMVLAAVSSPDTIHDAVNDGLITLRFMVENAEAKPLSRATLAQMRRVARQRLEAGKGLSVTTLWWAIDLATVLEDPELTRIVESLATDWSAVVARGVEDPDLIEQTQRRAADRLAGIPPLPRS